MILSKSNTTLILCALAALLEGFDNQSMGVAAPRVVRELGLSSGQASWIFSAATLGLAIGAMLGGRLGDRISRKWMLVFSLVCFGVFSLLTAMVTTPVTLFVVRLATGLGLGGAMPNFVTLANETVAPEKRLRVVASIMSALPLGGALAGLTASTESIGFDWRFIFYLGGVAPLLLALCMSRLLPNTSGAISRVQAQSTMPSPRIREVLFGRGQMLTTSLLWISFFFTQLILFLMLNWLPTLLVKSGFSSVQASWASLCFNFGGSIGSLIIGHLQSGRHRKFWVVCTYTGVALLLAEVALTNQTFQWMAVSCGLAGGVIVGAQLVLFGLAPLYYSREARGTGVGGRSRDRAHRFHGGPIVCRGANCRR